MEPLRKQQVTRRGALAGFAVAALAPIGCLKHLVSKEQAAPAPPQGRVVSTWDKRVAFAPDAHHGGAIIPGVVGRVYLFGPDMAYPYVGDGEMRLDLWDSTPRGPNSQPKQMEHYIISPEVLKQFAKKDVIGEGYSVFFPWPTYRQDVKQIYITILYTSAAGEKYFHQSGTFAVDHTETTERAQKGLSISNPALQVSATAPR
jgi:hypothetical protein